MKQIPDENYLEFDDCFPDGCIVDGSGADIEEVERLMAEVLASRKRDGQL